jgi:PilZ domain
MRTTSEYCHAVQSGLVRATYADTPATEKRPRRRQRVLLSAVVVYAEGKQSFDCTIRDISEGGARIAFQKGSQFPSSFYLINIRDRIVYDAGVVWCGPSEAGIAFTKTFPLSDLVDPAQSFLKRLWLNRASR